MPKRLTTEEWIQKARAVHGDRYDYSLVEYVNNRTKVKITCREHGEFEQRPINHTGGRVCPMCSGWKLTTEEWIKKARAMHGDKYDYSKVEYVNNKTDVKIICREHGEFEQAPHNHTGGKSCPICSGWKLTNEEWIKNARQVHGDKYDYSKVIYNKNIDKVTIICREHGKFKQTPNSHTNGNGCPRCPKSYGKPTALYILTNGEQVKVGIAMDPESRLSQLHRTQPFTADLVTSWFLADYPQALQVESEVHRRLADLNAGLTGFDGATEWFNTTPAHAAETIKQVMDEMGL